MAAPIDQWRKLLSECLARRIDVAEFCNLVKLLSKRAPLPEASLVDVILESRTVTNGQYDPLIPLYIDALTKIGKAKIAPVLNGLRRHSSVGNYSQSADDSKKGTAKLSSTLMTDTRIVQDAIVPISTPGLPLTSREVTSIFTEVSEWILTLIRAHTSSLAEDQQSGGLLNLPDALALFESLGIMLIALSATERGLDALSSDLSQGMRWLHFIYVYVYIDQDRFQNPAWSCSHCIPIILCYYFDELADAAGQYAKGLPTIRRAYSERPRRPDDGRHEHERPSIRGICD